ncbi:MAG: M48 family metalloprotease [Sphingomonadaceae bacterium]|uniref:M48 family metalloprotease n=1 Tax=Thermaurantiacus sp. TaxID=2820283 RepID=UPI00298F07B0|nr:M48 family metalloprotease [Thermaurantiacus sp.]MCS6986517.1 M48 family metalloprotease [Sphingomonadaceae bacterium]MDW8414222.1 M48 family metalloprotease [Thermaurantiacus sp.]
MWLLGLILLWVHGFAPAARAQVILRDAETEMLLHDIARPLARAAGLDPRSLQILLVGDSSINAFVTGGQNVFFHSGLVVAARDVNEVQGVMAHELGHIAGGHNVRFTEGVRPAMTFSLLGLLAGAAAMALGAGEAGMAAMALGQQAAQARFLAFSREQESRADQAGAAYLNAAGISGRGLIRFFEQLMGDEYRLAIPQTNSYNRTHPLSGERIRALEQALKASPAWDRPPDPALQARYARVRGKLLGYLYPLETVLKVYPETDLSEPARFARAYARHRAGFAAEAIAEAEAVARARPDDPFAQELLGQILLESGEIRRALPPLREAVRLSGGHPLITGLLGQALLQAAEDGRNAQALNEAERLLRTTVQRDRRNPQAWTQLAAIWAMKGDPPRVALATAERLSLTGGDPRLARRAAEQALAGLPRGSPDWLRAEDIALAAQGEIERLGLKDTEPGRRPRS